MTHAMESHVHDVVRKHCMRLKFCPARNTTCHKYNRAGHYQELCRSKNVGNIEQAEDNGESDECFSDEHFLGTVNANGNSWLTNYSEWCTG